MHHRGFTALLLLVWSASSQAIVNTENLRIGPTEDGFSGNLGLQASGKNGNTEKQDYGLDSRLQWQAGRNTDFLVLSYEYGESNEQRSSNAAFLHARHVTQFQPRRAWEAYVQLEQDEFTRLSYRGLFGLGLRFTLAERRDNLGLYFGAGIYTTRERLEKRTGLTDHGSESYERASLYLSYKHQINPQVALLSTTYYQPRLDDSDDYRALEQASLQVKMSKQLAVKLSINISHDSRPPQTIKETDVGYFSGLQYSF